MGKSNGNLHEAKKQKNDEFHTCLDDIEREGYYYKDQFKDKVIYCNCDDARESNFFKYFSLNFEFFGLKKLICTGYNENGHGTVLIYEGDKNGNRVVDDSEIQVQELEGNGDFRSEECIELLKQADIVVTNPPFSLFRAYVKQLMDYNKRFLIIGNQNAITYKEIFPYIKEGKLRMGHSMNGSNRWFVVPDNYEVKEGAAGHKVENGKKMLFVNGVAWFTNLYTHKSTRPSDLFKVYKGHEEEYPCYDNYNAINVDKVANLPKDLPIGQVVGVPITIAYQIADDGLIYFNDGGVGNNIQQYQIEKFRKGEDDKDLVYTVGNVEREREKQRDTADNTTILQNPYQAYQIVNMSTMSGVSANYWTMIKGKPKFARYFIKRIK